MPLNFYFIQKKIGACGGQRKYDVSCKYDKVDDIPWSAAYDMWFVETIDNNVKITQQPNSMRCCNRF